MIQTEADARLTSFSCASALFFMNAVINLPNAGSCINGRGILLFIPLLNVRKLPSYVSSDKQALRLSSGSSHVETQNFASDVVVCIRFFRHWPLRDAKFCVSTRGSTRGRQQAGGLLLLLDKRKFLSRARVRTLPSSCGKGGRRDADICHCRHGRGSASISRISRAVAQSAWIISS